MTESCARPRILDQVRLGGIPALDGFVAETNERKMYFKNGGDLHECGPPVIIFMAYSFIYTNLIEVCTLNL